MFRFNHLLRGLRPRFRSASFVFVLAGSVIPLAACSGSAAVGDPSTTAAGPTTTAALTTQVHGGARAIANALATVPLRADQRVTIEQMAKDSEVRNEPARKAREALMLAIADQVQTGTIDHAALQPKIDAVAAAHQAMRPADRAAFEKLHDLLTPDQRIAFVTALQSHNGNHDGKGGGMRGRMAKWAGDIGLTQDQQDQIRDKLQARWQSHFATAVVGTDEQKGAAVSDGHMMLQGHEIHARMEKTLEAFKGETFSMDAVAPIGDEKPMAHEFAGHMLGMIETALPVLTPDQRTAAAAKLRARASKMEEDDEAPAAQQQ